uniref:Trypsin-like protease n=1 Tax=Muljarus japonicus TaxID=501591 RepID=D2CM52_9HEMI|nr:trypsin-like protease [Muljarus japonicus]
MKFLFGLALLIGLAASRPDDRSYLTYQMSPEIDSDEVGQFRGSKLTNCTCGTTNKASGRIVGGKETLPNEYPFMVGLGLVTPVRMVVDEILCGAALLTEYHAITAAHCTFLNHQVYLALTVGDHDQTNRNKPEYHRVYLVDKIIEHEGWNERTVEHDIAILVTKERMQLSQHARPICLPNRQPNIVGQHVKVAGWGKTAFQGHTSPVLLKVSLKVIDIKFCNEQYPHQLTTKTVPTQLCTYSYMRDSCQQDSGGPVFWADPESNRYTLVGIVSFGAGCASTMPGVNTDVYAYSDWIQETVNNNSPQAVATCAKIG